MNLETAALVLSAVLGVVAFYGTARYAEIRRKFKSFVALLNEIVIAWDDDKISAEEFDKIIAKGKELLK